MPSNEKRRKERKGKFGQLRLGATENNELTLVSLAKFLKKEPKPIVRYEADLELFNDLPFSQLGDLEIVVTLQPPFPILCLPEELVLEILTIAVRDGFNKYGFYSRGNVYGIALSLCLVCKAFHRLVQPILYSKIQIHGLYGQDSSSVNRLYRTFQNSPSLSRHCKELFIWIQHNLNEAFLSEGFDVTLRVVCQFVNVKSLRLTGLFDNTVGNGDFSENDRDLWAFLRPMLSCIDRIEELEFSTSCGGFATGLGLPLYPLCTMLSGMQHLKTLRIYAISKRFDGTSFVLPKDLEGTSTITDLSIYACEESLSGLNELLKWPCKLEHFSIYDIYWYRGTNYLHDFRYILYHHRESLRSFCIENIENKGPINLSDFINLESVCFYSRTMTSKWMPEALCDNVLVAPRLYNLTWNFALFDEQTGPCTSCEDIGPAEAEWLRRVAQLAHERKLALREIRIRFDPWDVQYYRKKMEKSPWDWMEEVRVAMESLGIVLNYDKFQPEMLRRY